VVDRLGPQRAHDAQLVGAGAEVRQQLADLETGLAAPAEQKARRRDRQPLLVAGHRRQPLAHAHRGRQLLAGARPQAGFWIPEVDLRHAAREEQVDLAIALLPGGSTTTPSLAPAVRHAAWLARQELAELVARHLGVAPETIRFEDAKVGPGATARSWLVRVGRLAGPWDGSRRGQGADDSDDSTACAGQPVATA
jgi:hypothetical protein